MTKPSDHQIKIMSSINSRAVAWLMGMHEHSVKKNLSIPKNEDGTYSAREVLTYCVNDWKRRKDRPGDQDRIANQNGDPSASPLDEKRALEVKKLELELLKMQRKLVPVDHTVEFFGEMVSKLRKLGELLQRDYGGGALLLLNEAIGSMEGSITRWEESVREPDAE